MSDLLHRMETWRQGMGVRRFHTWPTIGKQTVGHHSCGVALIVVMCHPAPSATLLEYCLTHDLNEGVLGDLPATTKWRSPVLQAEWDKLEHQAAQAMGLSAEMLTEQESYCFHVADALEGLLWCREQELFGNKHYYTVAVNWFKHLDQFFDSHPSDVVPLKFRQLYADLWNYFKPGTPMEVVQ